MVVAFVSDSSLAFLPDSCLLRNCEIIHHCLFPCSRFSPYEIDESCPIVAPAQNETQNSSVAIKNGERKTKNAPKLGHFAFACDSRAISKDAQAYQLSSTRGVHTCLKVDSRVGVKLRTCSEDNLLLYIIHRGRICSKTALR